MKREMGLKQFEWLIFIAVMIVLFFSTQTYFGTANYSRVYRINTFFVIFFLVTSIGSNHGLLKYRYKDLFSYMVILLPYLLLFGISMTYYFIYHRITYSNMIYYNSQPILICLMAIVAYNSFGEKTLKGIIIAAVLNYIVYVGTCVIQYGPFSLLQAGSNSSASKLLEVHEITFVFGIIVVYLIISRYFQKKNTKRHWLVLLTVFCLLGFKRVLIMAVIFALVIYYLVRKKRKPTAIIIISCVAIVLSLAWVYLCSSWDLLTGISIAFNIDLSGRNWIYSNFYPYYSYSLSYMGAGVGYVQQLISQMSTMILGGHTIGLHNEYMRLFIELGFVPYICYFGVILPIMIKKIFRKAGIEAAVDYFVLWNVTLICITTDNLLTYPNYMLTFEVLILTCINNRGQQEKLELNVSKNIT